MKNLFTLLLLLASITAANAQLNCNNVTASISASVSGSTVTLTNGSTPTAGGNIYTTYYIYWGDGNYVVAQNNASQQHTYALPGPHRIIIYSSVLDSLNSIRCYDYDTVYATTTLNCDSVKADMYAHYNFTGYNLTLGNISTPNQQPGLSVEYKYYWGDGNTTTTTSKANQTHTYSAIGIYNISLVVTAYDSVNNITCRDTASMADTIYGNNPLYLCNSNNVYASFSVNANLGAITLRNWSQPGPGAGISATYNINWGDGNTTTTTNKNNQTHTYTTSGTYTIRVIATHSNSTNTCIDTFLHTRQIWTTPVADLIGYIYADSITTNDTYKVWLIKFNPSTNILSAVDSQIVARRFGLGYFNFPNTPHGSYRVKAHHINGPTTGTGNMPTYHDSVLLWSNAKVLVHNNTSANPVIYMKKGAVTNGPGFVGGNVQQGANKGTANGIEGMNILVLDSNGEPVAYDVTDANGDYNFNNLPDGTYTIHPEQLGYTTTPATITINSNRVTYWGVNFERSLSQKTIVPKPSGIVTVNNAQLSFTMHPNPAKNMVTLNWGEQTNEVADVVITDISGKTVFSTQTKMQGQSAIRFGNLQTGFYMLNVSSDLSSSTHKLFIQQ